jgi:hypothetical protein
VQDRASLAVTSAAAIAIAFASLAACALGDEPPQAELPPPGDDPTEPGGDGDDPDFPCLDCDHGLFPQLPEVGAVPFLLHPSPATPSGEEVLVAFAAPFPPDTVSDVDRLVVTDDAGDEIPTRVTELARWRVIDGAAPESVRSALFFAEVVFDGDPIPLELRWGVRRSRELGGNASARSTWVTAVGSGYAAPLEEPAAYAAFMPDWLSASLIRGRVTAVAEDAAWEWWDEALLGYGATAVNDVPANVQKIDYENSFEPWLYDRAMSLFGVYLRTGDVTWLRRGHLAAQFYADRVDGTGNFTLRPGDLKYSFGHSLVADYLMTGDDRLIEVVERIAGAGAGWPAVYTTSMNFWTERHQTYALGAAISAWELTGAPRHADRAREVLEASVAHVLAPPGGWQADGCLLHLQSAHEGAGPSQPVCSPWMSALLSDAAWRYYVTSRDESALVLAARLGEFAAAHGTYAGAENLNRVVPWYLSSSVHKYTDGGAWLDMEHSCDVAGMIARGAWARSELGGDPAPMLDASDILLDTCRFVLSHWHRPGGVSSGHAEWRLAPPRKFSWWFGSTLDLPWLLQSLGR